jgi:hypothetical protein
MLPFDYIVRRRYAMKVEAIRSTEKSASNEKWLEARLRYLMFKTNRWRPSKEVSYIYRKENGQEKS